jgi:SNF2 family DNA or RNA helicase
MTTPLSHVIITTRKKLDGLEPTLYDVVLCSPTQYNYLVDKFRNYAWKRFIYDEPTQTKIPAMRCIVSGFIWFVSATPVQLLYQNHNNHNFLQSLFSNCMDYHIFQNLIVKNDDEFVKKSFTLPPMHHHQHSCYQPLYKFVQNILSEPICNMIDAGNIEKAVRHLGGSTTSNIFALIKNEKEELLRETEFKIEKFNRIQDHTRVNKWTEKKAVLEKELAELDRRYKDYILNECCQICLVQIDQPTLVSCCQNAYCGKCLFQWLKEKNSCPNCRTFVTTDMILYLHSPSVPEKTNSIEVTTPLLPTPLSSQSKKTKPSVILDIIEKKPHGKFILFSNYDETFSFIRHALHDDGIQFAEISGTMESREKKIRQFKEGNIHVLFINSIANGAGINLQEATDIILYHRMEDDLQAQIIGRAYRIGRTTPLDVHHLV